MQIESERLILRLPNRTDIPEIISYYQRNIDLLQPVEPRRPQSFYTPPYWRQHVRQSLHEFHTDRSMRMFIFKPGQKTVLGALNFSAFERGTLQSCRVGYSIDVEHQKQGYMTEALTAGCRYLFTQRNMHRIQASYMPHNTASARVLAKVGFQDEGLARQLLLIDGTWADHIVSSLVNPFWLSPAEEIAMWGAGA